MCHTSSCAVTSRYSFRSHRNSSQTASLAGKPYEQIARERGFSYRQVYEWVRKYRKLGIAGLEDRRGERKISQTPRSREEELEKRIAELEHENHLLKLECELRKKVEELERGNR